MLWIRVRGLGQSTPRHWDKMLYKNKLKEESFILVVLSVPAFFQAPWPFVSWQPRTLTAALESPLHLLSLNSYPLCGFSAHPLPGPCQRPGQYSEWRSAAYNMGLLDRFSFPLVSCSLKSDLLWQPFHILSQVVFAIFCSCSWSELGLLQPFHSSPRQNLKTKFIPLS
jgi:hypothetical protein